jgi:hypothetical protein
VCACECECDRERVRCRWGTCVHAAIAANDVCNLSDTTPTTLTGSMLAEEEEENKDAVFNCVPMPPKTGGGVGAYLHGLGLRLSCTCKHCDASPGATISA